MWPRRPKRPHLVKTPFSAYLRGRLVGAGIGLPGEAEIYASDGEEVQIRLAFAIGVAARRRAPIMTERQLERAVRDRVDIAAMVAEVERDDDGSSSPPPPVAPVPVVEEEAARVQPRRWIGDPLPQT